MITMRDYFGGGVSFGGGTGGGCGSLCTHCSVSVMAADVQGEQSREAFSEPHEETLTDTRVA